MRRDPSLQWRGALLVGALAMACASVTTRTGSDGSADVAKDATARDAPAIDAPAIDAPAIDAPAIDATVDVSVFDATLDRTPFDAPMDATSDPIDDVYCALGRPRCIVCTSLVGAFVTRISGIRMTFRFEVDGTWTAETETDALPTPTARGRFSLSNNRLSLWDDPLDGATSACPGDVEGVYGIEAYYSCGAFQLRRLRDDCPARASALSDAFLTR